MYKLFICIVIFFSGCNDSVNDKNDSVEVLNTQENVTAILNDLEEKRSEPDIVSPVIELKGSKKIFLNIGEDFIDPGVVATDNIDGDITSKVLKVGEIDIDKEGIYKLTYMVSDAAGNDANVSREVIVADGSLKEKKVYINEFMSSNTHTVIDPDYYNFSDWIELYNNTDKTLDISGYALSDDKDKIKYKIPPGTTIKPHGYKIFWADKKERGNHTNFSLNTEGESVVLFDKNGNIIDKIDYDKQSADISMGRDKETLITGYMVPTFERANEKGHILKVRTDSPLFSIEGGFYDSPQIVTIKADDADEIFYTLDGSYPNKKSALKYIQPVKIDKTKTLRAVAYKKDKFESIDTTMTYFINHESKLPIISLSTDKKYLFDDMIGIYTDGKNGVPLKKCRGSETENFNYARDWQRPVHINYFDENQQERFSFNLDMEITGQCSRHNKKKSFSLSLEDKYGVKSLRYKLFDNKNVEKFKSFRIRTGDLGYKLRDILAVALVEEGKLNTDYEAYKAVQMFLNGEYWGIYNIREKKGADFIKSNYPDIKKSNLDIIGIKIKEGDKADYNDLHNFVKKNDLSLSKNYRQIKNRVDIDNYIDYMILEIYSNNNDWPSNNYRLWKEKKEGAKWRFILEDLDYGFVVLKREKNAFERVLNDDVLIADLFKKLLKNREFKKRFKDRFYTLLDTLFKPENVLALIKKLVDERREYFYNEPDKWDIDIDDFDHDVEIMKSFAKSRSEIVRKQLDSL